jgi:hypothetical protein
MKKEEKLNKVITKELKPIQLTTKISNLVEKKTMEHTKKYRSLTELMRGEVKEPIGVVFEIDLETGDLLVSRGLLEEFDNDDEEEDNK